MKLRNKKTGEIIDNAYIRETNDFYRNGKKTIAVFVEAKNRPPERASIGYETLAELNENWEDYEEPRRHYEILAMGAVMEREDAEDEIFRNQGQREIGNYFETREEAEKAVEKLKAWKRLKDTITCIDRASFDDAGTATLFIRYEKEYHKKVMDDLDLLFGGEE